MENMYQQAILDAKSLRASAMANAKSALEEAFEPRIQEMVRLKLSEELDGEAIDEDENLDDLSEENIEGLEEDDEVNDSELDEILAELDSLSEEDDTITDEEIVSESFWLDEAEEDEESDDEESDDEDETEKSDDEDTEDAGDEDMEDDMADEETKEITVPLSALKSVLDTIKSLSPDIDSEETSDDEMTDMGDSQELPDDEEVDSKEEETISLDEILAELEEEDAKSVEESKMKTELKEAKRIIKVLHESLSEVNLLNAKLLFMNKLFKSKTLTESQKVNVVKSFDKASTVKEVKYTYEVLKESIAVSKKSPIRESFGYASKPAGVSPNRNVIEADPFVARWQKIAGI